MQAAMGAVLAFALLWTIIVILYPDGDVRKTSDERSYAGQTSIGQYADTSIGQYEYQAQATIHATSPVKIQRVSTILHKSSHLGLTISSTDLFQQEVSAGNTRRTKPHSKPSSRTTTETKAPNRSSSSSQTKSPLFPNWIYYGAIVVIYQGRRFLKHRRSPPYEEDWFVRSGLDDRLVYDENREYEEDFLSVGGSLYGTMKWSGEELDKFDFDDV